MWGISKPKEADLRQHFKEMVFTITVDIIPLPFFFPGFSASVPPSIVCEFSHLGSFGGKQSVSSTLEGENTTDLLS